MCKNKGKKPFLFFFARVLSIFLKFLTGFKEWIGEEKHQKLFNLIIFECE